ncbi:related to CTI6 Cyc8-Tup1 Interacting protein [Rhynchosporium agropyri]|uniref:Related to CTI6 Cyc8-Tup1 Interacting protein n=1 Tax=Rhynchosporium agropyri TaxID=914238 RepID=A0A1E1K105_9HELO|nr:related to CTI6 Cyc8-Tup1 Interacting protein [Rhynchosporium agropyri]
MDTARRSSRAARASQPLQSTSQHSSASSNSSGRADRATRSHIKPGSPRKSTPGSLSSEPAEDSNKVAVEESTLTRPKRGRAEEQPKSTKSQPKQAEIINGEEEVGEDDEAVRCICGFEEYPGPPQIGDEDSKAGIKEGTEEPVITPADITEDLAGFFLQCDMCKVWQHGGCVGIMNEDTSPDEYFCEGCRKDLHKILVASNGQRYSHYLPLYPTLSRTTSRAGSFSKDGTRSPRGSKIGRPSSSLQSNAKRRSTMNSRDAAYDEAAEIQRAIEASKGEKSGESTDGGTTRRGKRGRSDSEEKQEGPKRQRTASASPSPSPIPDARTFQAQAESDDEANGKPSGGKKIRGAAARNHKEKELREERERLRQEAANKRKGRAERRRVEDSEPTEELPLVRRDSVAKSTEVAPQPLDPPPSSQPAAPDTPPPNPPPVSHKKGGRPPNARKGKLGKNQYTKEREGLGNDGQSPNRSQSRDVSKPEESEAASIKPTSHEGKIGRTKGINSKVAMLDMKKRVTAMLAFISQTEYELGGSISPTTEEATAEIMKGLADGLPMIRINGENGHGSKGGEAGEHSSREFKDLSCKEMIVDLTKQLLRWQDEFA